MHAKPTIALLGLALTAGCMDLGLEGNVPLDQAMEREPLPLVAVTTAPVENEPGHVIVEGKLWLPAGRPVARGSADLRPVGAADAHTVFARSWDRPPYHALFVPTGDGYQEFAPVLGRSGPAGVAATPGSATPGADAGHDGH